MTAVFKASLALLALLFNKSWCAPSIDPDSCGIDDCDSCGSEFGRESYLLLDEDFVSGYGPRCGGCEDVGLWIGEGYDHVYGGYGGCGGCGGCEDVGLWIGEGYDHAYGECGGCGGCEDDGLWLGEDCNSCGNEVGYAGLGHGSGYGRGGEYFGTGRGGRYVSGGHGDEFGGYGLGYNGLGYAGGCNELGQGGVYNELGHTGGYNEYELGSDQSFLSSADKDVSCGYDSLSSGSETGSVDLYDLNRDCFYDRGHTGFGKFLDYDDRLSSSAGSSFSESFNDDSCDSKYVLSSSFVKHYDDSDHDKQCDSYSRGFEACNEELITSDCSSDIDYALLQDSSTHSEELKSIDEGCQELESFETEQSSLDVVDSAQCYELQEFCEGGERETLNSCGQEAEFGNISKESYETAYKELDEIYLNEPCGC